MVGISDRYTKPKDAVILKNSLKRVTDEFPEVVVAICNDIELYNLFNNISDDHKLLIPLNGTEYYPFVLSQFDILILPLKGGPSDQTLSDLALMEAGARQIPWVASPIPSYKDWGVGGLFAQDKGDWYSAIRKLITSKDTRLSLAKQGYEKSMQRESNNLIEIWKKAILP